jgi:hypothetical protein
MSSLQERMKLILIADKIIWMIEVVHSIALPDTELYDSFQRFRE